MAVRIAPLVVPEPTVAEPPRAGVGRLRKIGMLGSHTNSLVPCPWSDTSWELWGHASARGYYTRTPDRFFDLHPKVCWTRKGKLSGKYPQWLAKNLQPVYMQDIYPEVPASVRYPKERILQEFDARYMTSHLAWMIALALTEGVTHIGLWGINYGAESEYATQRGSAEHWLGVAIGRGVQIVKPPQCNLLGQPAELYGYESHDEDAKLVESYRPKLLTVQVGESETVVRVDATSIPLMTPPADCAADVASEAAEMADLRPDMPWEQT